MNMRTFLKLLIIPLLGICDQVSNWWVNSLQHDIIYKFGLIDSLDSPKASYYSGMIFITFYLFRIPGNFLFGTLADKYGICRILFAALIFQGICNSLYGVIDSFYWFIFIRGLVGFTTVLNPLSRALIMLWAPEGNFRRNTTLFLTSSILFFNMVGSLIGGELYDLFDQNFKKVGISFSAFEVSVGIIFIIVYQDVNKTEQKLRAEKKKEISMKMSQLKLSKSLLSDDTIYQEIQDAHKVSWRQILTTKKYIYLGMIFALMWSFKNIHMIIATQWILLGKDYEGLGYTKLEMNLIYMVSGGTMIVIMAFVVPNLKVKNVSLIYFSQSVAIICSILYCFLGLINHATVQIIVFFIIETTLYMMLSIVSVGYQFEVNCEIPKEVSSRVNSLNFIIMCTLIATITQPCSALLGYLFSNEDVQAKIGYWKVWIGFMPPILVFILVLWVIKKYSQEKIKHAKMEMNTQSYVESIDQAKKITL